MKSERMTMINFPRLVIVTFLFSIGIINFRMTVSDFVIGEYRPAMKRSNFPTGIRFWSIYNFYFPFTVVAPHLNRQFCNQISLKCPIWQV